MGGHLGSEVYARVRKFPIGTRVFGTGPYEGEALVVDHLGGATRLRVTLAPRFATVDLLPDGELQGTLDPIEPGKEAAWPLVTSKKIEGTAARPYIRVQPTKPDHPSKPEGQEVELAYREP